ncbi:hypothetical protein ACJMK2_041117 [Sinanodonta woodiana]|uniref:Apple domain-containing protein n=1 Tax=Sinanodonta woodiana TaxID=1069815 RepID=A0ABD3W3P8_SINWO
MPTYPTSFQVNIQGIILDKNYTLDATMYYDFPGNRAAMRTFSHGLDGRTIFNYATDEIFLLTENVCQTFNLSTSPDKVLFGETYSNGAPHIMSSTIALKFGPEFGEVYMGTATILGMTVQHWQACIYWNSTNSTFLVDYYFTQNWDTPSTYQHVPVMANVTGSKWQNGTQTFFNHLYNYYAFHVVLDQDPDIFTTPKGVVCPGRKSTRPIPQLPDYFYVRVEMIYPDLGTVSATDVWYDEDYKLFRKDYRPLSAYDPTYTTNPLTEIHDFNTGVRYIIDNLMGNCTILPLLNSSSDSMTNMTARKVNGTYVVEMKTPRQYFNIDNSFTYAGQRWERGLLVDVFIAQSTNLYLGSYVDYANSTVELSFLSSNWAEIPNDGTVQDGPNVPVKMEITADSVGFHVIYNYMDFDEQHPDIKLFDVARCYAEGQKAQFQVRLTGTYRKATSTYLQDLSHLRFAQTMNISPLRIQDIRVDYDDAFIFLSATLLDRVPPTAQFTYTPKRVVEKVEDTVVYNISFPWDCAQICVNDVNNYTCNSFDFCSADSTCHLSKLHIPDGSALLVNSTVCDHFSRTVDGPIAHQMTILEAFTKLRTAVYQGAFELYVKDLDLIYKAVDVTVTFGWITNQPQFVQLPRLPDMFSYKLEIVSPGSAIVYNAQVRFASKYRLVKYDFHTANLQPPFYAKNPVTVIHDFNTGIAYNIDRIYDNCTITQIPNNGVDSIQDNADKKKDNSYILRMRSPLELFKIDNTYRFVGQRTTRGILCNVFESLRTDFQLPDYNGTFHSIFQFYFLETGWKETSTGLGSSTMQPVRLDITAIEPSVFMMYNIYDFDESDPNINQFDVTKCFGPEQQQHFQITFNQMFHPALDTMQEIFLLESQLFLAKATTASPLRFQRTQIDHDDNNVYLTSTLLGQPSFLLDFTKVGNKISVHQSDRTIPGIQSALDCAVICMSISSIQCNSFDFCTNSQDCLLSQYHVPDGPNLTSSLTCDHYSRTVNFIGAPQPSLLDAYINLKDAVYKGIFQIPIPYGSKAVVYTANAVRDDISRPQTDSRQGQDISHFTVMRNHAILQIIGYTQTTLAVDDCATACILEETFECKSYTYCYNTAMCIMNNIHPDQNSTMIQSSTSCDLYIRNYLDDYTKAPGTMDVLSGDKEVSGVANANDCGHTCSSYSSFSCKAFQYCPDESMCLLFKTYSMRNNPNRTNPSAEQCSFYSRSHISDFTRMNGRTLLFGPSVLEYNTISLDECANTCIEQKDLGCKGFYYCGSILTCMLTSGIAGSGDVNESDAGVYCLFYARQYLPSGSSHSLSTSPTRSPASSTRSVTSPSMCVTAVPSSGNTQSRNIGPEHQRTVYRDKIDTGSIVGVAFGLFIAGLLTGTAAMHFRRRWKEKGIKYQDWQNEFDT